MPPIKWLRNKLKSIPQCSDSIQRQKALGIEQTIFFALQRKNEKLKSSTHSSASNEEGIHPLPVEMVDNSPSKPAASLAKSHWWLTQQFVQVSLWKRLYLEEGAKFKIKPEIPPTK